MNPGTTDLFEEVEKLISSLAAAEIPEQRRNLLKPLITYLQGKLDAQEEILLSFICTHNSRRSHLAQVWAQTLASYFNIPALRSYSAGTEATALFPKVLETLSSSGFEILSLSEGNNPVYAIRYGSRVNPIIGFSKTLDHRFNPDSGFAAVMTCTQADEGCPFVAGAEKRISLPYEDPKVFDSSLHQDEKYRERSLQIASELYYVFSHLDLNHGKQ